MTVDPTQLSFYSNMPGFGSPEYKTLSFTIPAQTIADGTFYVHTTQTLDFDNAPELATVRIQYSGLDGDWHDPKQSIIYKADNTIYLAGNWFSISNSDTSFEITPYIRFTANSMLITMYLLERKIGGGAASVPSITVNVKVYLYEPPV